MFLPWAYDSSQLSIVWLFWVAGHYGPAVWLTPVTVVGYTLVPARLGYYCSLAGAYTSIPSSYVASSPPP
jgi:hypothetical protein